MKLSAGLSVFQIFVAYGFARNLNFPCKDDQFYNVDTGTCSKCSICPDNNLILNLCGQYWDTKCEPLSGFNLENIPVQNVHFNPTTSKTGVISQGPEEVMGLDGKYWFTMSMILFGILCLVCLCIIAFIITTLRRRKNKDKQIMYNPVLIQQQDDEEPRYIDVFRQPFLDRLKQHRSLNDNRTLSTFQSTSGLQLLLPQQQSENIYINCMEYFPEVSQNKRKDTDDYVYLESN